MASDEDADAATPESMRPSSVTRRGAKGDLDHTGLVSALRERLATPRRRHGFAARALLPCSTPCTAGRARSPVDPRGTHRQIGCCRRLLSLRRVPPQVLAFVYYQISWLLYVLRPGWSYRLNADFEDHAEHEYMEMVGEHPEWEDERYESAFAADYARLATVADLFRQIGYDERVHKEASVQRMSEPRFR